jgi:hypothetical protein
MALDQYHLTKDGDLWKLKKTGGKAASLTAQTKAEAISKMRAFMSGKRATVRIHKQDGKIQEERTYPRSADPRRTKG